MIKYLVLFIVLLNALAFGQTTTTTERKLLEYPDPGYPPGTALENLIKGIWDSLDANANARYVRQAALGNGSALELEHGLMANLVDLQCVGFLFTDLGGGLYDHDPITDYTNYPITEVVGSERTKVEITNNSGSAQDIAISCRFANDYLQKLTIDNVNINGQTISGNDTGNPLTITAPTGQTVSIESITFDGGIMGGVVQFNIDNLRLDGNTIDITQTDGNLILDANGTGVVQILKKLELSDELASTNATSFIINAATSKPIVIEGVNIQDQIMSLINQITVDNISIDGNAISSTDTNGDIQLTPDGTGVVDIQSTMQCLKADIDNIDIDGNTITTTDTNGDLILSADGSGIIDSQNILQSIQVDVDNLTLDGNTLSSTDTDGDITLTPDGDGQVQVDQHKFPITTCEEGQTLIDDGSGNLSCGASGDASFKPVEEATQTLKISKGRYQKNGKRICTWDGSGSASTDIADLSISTSALADDIYKVYVDTNGLTPTTLTDEELVCYFVTASEVALLTDAEADVASNQYFGPFGTVTTSSGNITNISDNRPEEAVSWASINYDSHPTGSITAFGSSTMPDGWLLCDGTAVSRTTYLALFNTIGTTYGVGDGSTTFNLPNLQGVFPRGAGSQSINGRTKGGNSLGDTTEDVFQGHWHDNFVDKGAATGTQNNIPTSNGTGTGTTITGSTKGAGTDGVNGTPRTDDETYPSNVAVNYIIKYSEPKTSEIATPANTFEQVHTAKPTTTTNCPSGYTEALVNSNVTTQYGAEARYWDNSFSTAGWQLLKMVNLFVKSGYVCMKTTDLDALDWAASDKLKIRTSPGIQVAALPEATPDQGGYLPTHANMSDAKATELGYKKYHGNGTDFTVSDGGSPGTPTWTDVDSWAIPYKTTDGTWHLKFNITGNWSGGSTNHWRDIAISGVTFRDEAAYYYYQAITVGLDGLNNFGGKSFIALAKNGEGDVRIVGTNTVLSTEWDNDYWSLAGDVELDSKPTWAD